MQVLLLGLPAAAFLFLSSRRSQIVRPALSGSATVLALGTTLVACASGLSTISALVCILFGTLVAVSAAATRERIWTLCGAAVALFGVGSQVLLAVRDDNVLRWASLSIAGVLLIVGAAYMERHRTRVTELWERLHTKRLQSLETLPDIVESAA